MTMTDDPYSDRRHLTFEQAEGVEPLPTQLQAKELSQKLRSCLWYVVHCSLKENTKKSGIGDRYLEFRPNLEDIFYWYHVFHENLMVDEFANDAAKLHARLRGYSSMGTTVRSLGSCNLSFATESVPPGFLMRSTRL